MTREFRSHAFANLLDGMQAAATIGRQALQALDQVHLAFPEHRGVWRGTDFYADKLGEGVRRLAFEVRLRRGEDEDELVPCAARREIKHLGTPVFAAGTLLAVVGYVDMAGNLRKLGGPSFEGKPSWREVQAQLTEVRVTNHNHREVTVKVEDLDFSPAAILAARPRPRLDDFDKED